MKVYHCNEWHNEYTEFYMKDEADKVIAYRDCEIKKLKDSLNKLLKAKTEQILQEVIQKALIYGDGFVPVEHAIKLVAENRHSKYKRCLAMAMWCEAAALWCYQAANTLPVGFHATLYGKPVMIEPNRLFKRHALLTKWSARWFKLAKEFKSEYENGRR